MRLLSSLSDMDKFKLWSDNTPQAFIQTEDNRDRDLYVMDVPADFRLQDGECPQTVKPIYGLGEPGDLWHATNGGTWYVPRRNLDYILTAMSTTETGPALCTLITC